jgi:hypothetical protein
METPRIKPEGQEKPVWLMLGFWCSGESLLRVGPTKSAQEEIGIPFRAD